MIRFIAFMGPSASGKTTLKNQLKLNRLVTYTTRKPRVGETEGVDYFFVEDKTFEQLKSSGKLLESTIYGGASYGLGYEGIAYALKGNLIYGVVLDASGIEALSSRYPEETLVVGVFADAKTTKERLSDRGDEDGDLRLLQYEEELKALMKWSHLVINTSKFDKNEASKIVENVIDLLRKGGN